MEHRSVEQQPDEAVLSSPPGPAEPPQAGPPPSPWVPGAGEEVPRIAVLEAAQRLRKELAALALPFDLPGVGELRRERERLLSRLDAYVLPRLRRMDAPLLVVIGGSTGAGKSTLTNSLVGLAISPAGVLRPTTRSPVLVHHPDDRGAFLSRRILPGLERRTPLGADGLEQEATRIPATGSIMLVPHESVPQGLAVIDSPDLDSHLQANRELAAQLFEVADLWLFVTTGTDYADMVPWELLAEAVERQVSVAVVLDRMRDTEVDEVRVHCATMLRDRGLAGAPLFTIPETTLVGGLLPPRHTSALQRWLTAQAGDVGTRDGHVGKAVRGALEMALRAVPGLSAGVAAQAAADRGTRADLEVAFTRMAQDVQVQLDAGGLLAGRVEAGWHALAGPGEPTVEAGRLRRRMQAALRGQATRYEAISHAVHASVGTLLATQVQEALNRAAAAWRGRPEAAAALSRHAELARPAPGLEERATATVRQWQAAVLDGLHAAAGWGRLAGSDPTVVALVCLVLGADAGWIGPAARRLLAGEAPGLDVGAELARAREALQRHVGELFASERARVDAALDEVGGGAAGGWRLRAAADSLSRTLDALGPATV